MDADSTTPFATSKYLKITTLQIAASAWEYAASVREAVLRPYSARKECQAYLAIAFYDPNAPKP